MSAKTTDSPPRLDNVDKDAGIVRGESDSPAKAGEGIERTFGGMTPSEAANARWAKARERAANGLTEREDARSVRVPIRVGKIIGQLERAAGTGDVGAARELRSWLSEYPAEDTAFDLEALDKQLRTRIALRLVAEIESESPAYAPISGGHVSDTLVPPPGDEPILCDTVVEPKTSPETGVRQDIVTAPTPTPLNVGVPGGTESLDPPEERDTQPSPHKAPAKRKRKPE